MRIREDQKDKILMRSKDKILHTKTNDQDKILHTDIEDLKKARSKHIEETYTCKEKTHIVQLQ